MGHSMYGMIGDPKTATSKIGKSPRGDYYDWCCLEEDGTLTFGNEQGNYAGGANLYYGSTYTVTTSNGEKKRAEYFGDAYWNEVKRFLDYQKEYDSIFYSNIMEMLQRNNFKLPWEE